MGLCVGITQTPRCPFAGSLRAAAAGALAPPARPRGGRTPAHTRHGHPADTRTYTHTQLKSSRPLLWVCVWELHKPHAHTPRTPPRVRHRTPCAYASRCTHAAEQHLQHQGAARHACTFAAHCVDAASFKERMQRGVCMPRACTSPRNPQSDTRSPPVPSFGRGCCHSAVQSSAAQSSRQCPPRERQCPPPSV